MSDQKHEGMRLLALLTVIVAALILRRFRRDVRTWSSEPYADVDWLRQTGAL